MNTRHRKDADVGIAWDGQQDPNPPAAGRRGGLPPSAANPRTGNGRGGWARKLTIGWPDWRLQPHGTEARAQWHRRHHEPPCGPCADAETRAAQGRLELYRRTRLERRNQIRAMDIKAGPDLPGWPGVPVMIGNVPCLDCGQLKATVTHDARPDQPRAAILQCAGCGAIFDLNTAAYGTGLAAGILLGLLTELETV